MGSSRGYQGVWEQLARGLVVEDWGAGEHLETQHVVSGNRGERILAATCTYHSRTSPRLANIPSSPHSDPHSPITNLEHWLNTLPHQAAIHAARQIGSKGPVLAPMAACATGIWALAQGFELIKTGQCQRVLAGAVEAPITRLTIAGFEKIGALAKTGAYPFDQYREGLVLGEGAAVLVLESAQSALSREVKIYGQLLGFGLTCDAYRVTAPHPDQHSAIAAVKQCLDRSQLSPTDIDYIHAHGTATYINDDYEAQLIKHLFPHSVPISSTKGATGHTLGASGALGTAFCLMTLKHQCLPPCVGNQQPEFDLDLVKTPRLGKTRLFL